MIQKFYQMVNTHPTVGTKVILYRRGSLNHKFKKLSEYDVGIAYIPYEKESVLFTKAPSLKSLEYAAAGIPIIASATAGHIEYMKRYGFQFELFENTKTTFLSVMEKITRNGIPDDMVSNNLDKVKAFGWKSSAENKLIPLYRRLAEKC